MLNAFGALAQGTRLVLSPGLRRYVFLPVVANLDAEPKRDAASAIEALVRQVTAPVRWEQVVRRLASDGVDTYVEVGSGLVLSGLIRRIDRSATVLSASDPESVDEVVSALAG